MNTTAQPKPIAAPHEHLSETFLALLELVECKDIKDEMERLDNGLGSAEEQSRYTEERQASLKSDYDRRKPAAWEKAREVLHTCGWHTVLEGQPEEGRMLVLITENGNMRCGTFERGKVKDWIPGVIAWSYAQLPRF